MVCKNCGAKLKNGCVYCSVCGQEVQIVPDYNILENDIIDSYIGDDELIKKNKSRLLTAEERLKTSNLPVMIADGVKKSTKKGRILFASTAAICLVTALFIWLGHRQDVSNQYNSYDYQLEMGIAAMEDDEDHEKAVSYLERALELKENDINTMLLLAEARIGAGESEAAEKTLLDILALKPDNINAYELLIGLYSENNEYEKLGSLAKGVSDPRILDLLAEYIVMPPALSSNTGKYFDDLLITITSSKDYTIYYTTDGSDPVENGTQYRNPVSFKGEGTYELKAVCIDDHGVYSEEIDATYQISYSTPDIPTVSLQSGTYEGEQWITVNTQEGCAVYYTWDGTDPTTASERYIDPIMLPEGDYTLSLIAVSPKGKASNVVRFQYTRI